MTVFFVGETFICHFYLLYYKRAISMKNFDKNLRIIFISYFCIQLIIPISTSGILITINNPIDIIFTNSYINFLYDDHQFPEGYSSNDISNELSLIDNYQNNLNKITTKIISNSKESNFKGNEWPMYCHDRKHTGRSPYNTAENIMEEKWCVILNGISYHCAPVLDSQGTIYAGREQFYAIYPNSTLKWEIDTQHPLQDCPAIDEQRGVLYYGTQWGMPNYFYAIYLLNGTIKWTYYVGNDITSSPAIDTFGNIYFGDWNGNVHALYPDGTQKWIYHTGDVITSSPAIGEDETIYIGSHDNYVYAFYFNGTLKWRFQTGNWVHASPTLGDDGTVYIGSDDGYLYALNQDNGSMIWRVYIGGTWCSPTLGPDGTIYLGVWEMKFYAINPNGFIKWIYNTPGRIWLGNSAVISNDGILYFGTTWIDGGTGAFIALNANDGTERFIDYYGWYETSPAITSDGIVYAVTSNHDNFTGALHAFGSHDPNAPSAPIVVGKLKGKTETSYDYIFRSTSPVGNDIYYQINWGDGTITDWIGPYDSGERITMNHSWMDKGTYTIKARAKDTNNLWGPWGVLKVTMPYSYEPQFPFIQWLLVRFPNAFPILRYLNNLS